MSALEFLSDNNVQPDTHISFVYNGGSRPGTRRSVVFSAMHELRSGAQGFRASDDGVAKTYELAKCSGMRFLMPDDADSDSDASVDAESEMLGLRIENNDLKRRLEEANAEIAALKRRRRETAEQVRRILFPAQ